MALRSSALLVGFAAFIFATALLPADARPVIEAMSSRLEVRTDQPASFSITNVMDDSVQVSAHCHSIQRDTQPTLIAPLTTYTINFQEDLTANIPWTCDFSVVGGTETQSFPVWTHDSTPYVSECDECSWNVRTDGFYILSALKNIYINVHPWNI